MLLQLKKSFVSQTDEENVFVQNFRVEIYGPSDVSVVGAYSELKIP